MSLRYEKIFKFKLTLIIPMSRRSACRQDGEDGGDWHGCQGLAYQATLKLSRR